MTMTGHVWPYRVPAIHESAFIAPGAHAVGDVRVGVTAGKTIKSGQLWLGRPARYVRDLSPGESTRIACRSLTT